jgi:hypothetical protein
MHWAAHNSVRHADFDAVGGFDEEFHYRQDSELGLRLAQSGVRMIVDPDLVVEHRGAAHDAHTRAARAWVSGASEVLFANRHKGLPVRPAAARPTSVKGTAWVWATQALATCLPRRSLAGLAGLVTDALLVVLPSGLGGRVVALVVESAAEAGRRYGTRDQGSLRAQKNSELARERSGRGGRG